VLACTAALAAPLPGQSNCASARITQSGKISMDTKISWKPVACKLVLQAYQEGRLVGEYGKESGVAPGTISAGQLTEGVAGTTELKVWVPGAPVPSNAVWVTVEPK
jgi:hypothetical protein